MRDVRRCSAKSLGYGILRGRGREDGGGRATSRGERCIRRDNRFHFWVIVKDDKFVRIATIGSAMPSVDMLVIEE
jgi:hypothetical protein